ncbi:MAG: 3-hydroxyacyl-CoA dehydrogenase NAD-binding domain-containing protein [Hyphomicrobiales bacterium]
MPVTFSRTPEGVAVIEIDNPPVNALSQEVRKALLEAIEQADADRAVKAVVIAGAGKLFSGGADIREFDGAPREPYLPVLLDRIEAAAKPVVVAWHGTSLGGACEIGLAAHARVIAKGGTVGLPEVTIGIPPGAGGTQRLPRLVGVPAALDMIVPGRRVPPAEALAIGLVDRVAEGDVRAEAIALARSLADTAPRRTSAQPVPAYDAAKAKEAADALLKRTRGQTAPAEAARLVLATASRPYAEGIADERATFLKLKNGEEAAALRHAFFAEREAAKHPALEGVAPYPVKTVGVIGAGTMGSGIAVAFLDNGYPVTVVEQSAEGAAAGRARIEGLLNRAVTSGRLSETERDRRLAALTVSTDLQALIRCDLVIEAVFEDMAVKKELFVRLGSVLKQDAVLATNTSYLDVNQMAEVVPHPDRFLGLHFFSPANVMKLLEVVRGRRTSPATLATGLAVGKALGKVSVVSGVCDGFIGNRILARYRQECEFMLEEGALPKDVDQAFESWGFAMGPFAVQDLSGLDISWARRKRLAPFRKPTDRYVPIADQLCEMGRFGQKTGAGWYRYENGKRIADPDVEALVRKHAASTGRPQRTFAPAEIMARVLETMAREGQAILAEGVAACPSDIDVVLLNGYGFPRHKGGPMFQASRPR